MCGLFVHQGLLSGLCGNFDSVTVNDMTTSSHIEVNNAQTFGDSWALGQVFLNSSLFHCASVLLLLIYMSIPPPESMVVFQCIQTLSHLLSASACLA